MAMGAHRKGAGAPPSWVEALGLTCFGVLAITLCSDRRMTQMSRRWKAYEKLYDLGVSKLLRNENRFNGGSKGGFRRFFRGQNYRLILESNRNRAGDFMKRMKIQNGEVKNILVPGEFQFKGWKSFLGCLDKLFTRNKRPPVSNQIRPDYTKRSEWKIQSKRAATLGQRDSEIVKIRPILKREWRSLGSVLW
ncbi:hypothetical protein TIFTF001_031076 [Ficus carica]|uniref:Uncharacterized protein n=1 Tax=Ficus carica TaxID=3494 RepID=A0AA88J0I9_FICCA|nr:hypothetical protein TIFTF001_031076 [Ficus carica]